MGDVGSYAGGSPRSLDRMHATPRLTLGSGRSRIGRSSERRRSDAGRSGGSSEPRLSFRRGRQGHVIPRHSRSNHDSATLRVWTRARTSAETKVHASADSQNLGSGKPCAIPSSKGSYREVCSAMEHPSSWHGGTTGTIEVYRSTSPKDHFSEDRNIRGTRAARYGSIDGPPGCGPGRVSWARERTE